MFATVKLALNDPEIRKRMLFLIILGSTIMITVAVLIFSLSVAWFSTNGSVSAGGMAVKCEGTENLVISDSAEEIIHATAFEEHLSYVTFDSPIPAMDAATHTDDYDSFPSGLMYPASAEGVEITTGLTDGEFLNAAGVASEEASADDESVNYVDYTVYISSVGGEMVCGGLAVCVNPTTTYVGCEEGEKAVTGTRYWEKDDENNFRERAGFSEGDDVTGLYTKDYTKKHFRAASIDVYNGVPGDGGVYKGTLSLNDTSRVLPLIDAPMTIGGENYITITLRGYFDGAAVGEDGKAILRSGRMSAADMFFGVRFEAASNLTEEQPDT